MPAPRRSAPRRTAPAPAVELLEKTTVPSSSGMIYNDTSRVEQPMVIRSPGNPIDSTSRDLMRFSQLIMMGIALAAIWGGLFSIAFAEDASNDDFLILFLGGFLSAGIAIGWIAAQSKKNDYVLYEVQDYMLGIGLFFATIGTVWGSRWLIGFVTGEGWTEIFGTAAEFNSGVLIDATTGEEVDWHPNAKAIYVQTAALLALIFAELQLFKRFKGATGFGRAVSAYAPILVLVAAGMGPWMRWTDNVISYEMGISLILLCFASMELALRSNKALNFVVVAVVSGLTPILFEVFNTNAEVGGEGGALSLLVFIIALQGYYASRQELRSELIQKASIVLVGEIVFAMFIARTQDLNLHLGPVKSAELGIDHLFGLSVALWIAVLAFYFPAVQQRRVPWMPIGLAAALVVLPNDGSVIPWAVSLLMIPYMLFIAKATRRWVADYTFAMLAVAYFMTDVIANIENIPLSGTFGYDGMQVIIPLALFVISEYARRTDKISSWTHLVMLAALVLSRTIIQAEDWFMPWIFIGYLLYLARDSFSNLSEESEWKEKMQATLVVIIANASMILLAVLDRLDLPQFLDTEVLPEYFNYQIFILGIVGYLALYKARTIELDAGLLFNWTKRLASKAPMYNPETNTWTTPDQDTEQEVANWQEMNSWSQLTRISLIVPFFMMSFSIVTMSDPWNGFDTDGSQSLVTYPWILMLLAPVYGLVHEIRGMEIISSTVRSAGVWVLFAITVPVSISFNVVRSEMLQIEKYVDTAIMPVPILLDLILLSAPLYVNSLIAKRGIDTEHLSENADRWAMLGLIAFACLDTSGGLLLISMLGLVTVRSVRHRHVLPLLLSPAVFILLQSTWLNYAGIARTLFESADTLSYDFTEDGFLGLPRIGGLIIAGQMLYAIIMDSRMVKNSSSNREPLPWYGLWGWALVGILAASSSIGWIPAIFFAYLMINAWLSGTLNSLPALHLGFLISLIVGMAVEEVADTWALAFSWSALITGFAALGFSAMGSNGILFKNVPEAREEFYTEQKKSEIINTLYVVTYVLFLVSYEAFNGIGTLVGAIILTRDIVTKGYTNAVFFVPAIHALALMNLLVQTDFDMIQEGIVLGSVLLIEGLIVSWLSLQNDRVYDFKFFEWENDDAFLDFIDRLGIAGVLFSLSGIYFIFADFNQTTVGWLLATAVLMAVGIQGYSPENDARWRRIIGGYGSIFAFIGFSSGIESNTMQSLSWIGVGLIALGWGFMMMQRLENDEQIYHSSEEAIPEGLAMNEAVLIADESVEIPEPVFEAEEEESVEDEEDFDEANEQQLPEPVLKKKTSKAIPKPVVEQYVLPAAIDTGLGFEIRLPPGKLEAIVKSIRSTPHEGYKPIVGMHENGKIVIDWVEV
jgi:hypothetical protein